LQPLYNLLENGAEADLLPYCLREKIGVLVYSPLAKGLLAGKYTGTEKFNDFRANLPQFTGQQFLSLATKVQNLQPIAAENRLSISQLVLAATLSHPAIDCVIVGIKNSQQIQEAAGAIGQSISREDYFKIRTILGS
jgi:aryl-alcohol dehydrogenase-like predicted oxidoreductase